MQNDVKKERQKKFLLVLPVIVLPFVTFLLWAVGIVGGSAVKAQGAAPIQGFNMHLPDAKNKQQRNWSKLNFYEQADKDSAKYKDALQHDPFFNLPKMDTGHASPVDANEQKVYAKLAELKTALNQPAQAAPSLQATMPAQQSATNTADVDRLERMLQGLQQKGDTTDPEMQQLNALMDKVIAAQHPETVKPVHVDTAVVAGYAVAVQHADTLQAAAFYSLSDGVMDAGASNAIQAVVDETQTVVSGATVKLRLVTGVTINGFALPANTLVYGIATLSGERLNIAINSVRVGATILPVSLSVYDMDGLAGVYIPGAITRDVAKQSADESLQGIGLTTLDPSIGAQAASAGIQTVKTLIGKKVRLVKVTLKAGYEVFLKDNNQKK